jgi:hypothetical protein
MIVRMQHKDHGFTHVYDTSELNRHKTLGWTECVEAPKPAPVVAQKQEEKEPEVQAPKVKSRFSESTI